MVGKTARINTIFNPNGGASGAATVDVYINGTWVEQQTGGGSPSYNKVGAYVSSTGTGPCTTTWQNILFWTGGSANNGTPVVVDPPSFSPAAGTYGASQTVTISSTTSGATIRYTTDGSTPSETNGTVYASPVTVSATNTLQAIAYESGQTDSPAAAAAYTILTPAATPTFNTGTGTYTSAQTVTISSATSGASIVYTTDGSTPAEISGTVTNGTLLTNGSSVLIGANATLNAIAFGGGSADSTVATATYTINPATVVSAPTFSPAAGTYTIAQSVTLSSTNGTTIYYTTNGAVPTTSSAVYSSALNMTQWTKLQAIASATGLTTSPVATAVYTMNIPQVALPTFSLATGTYTAAQSVTINSATLGATIRYTTDGSTPSETNGTVYSGAITVGSTTSLMAIAYESNDTDSAIGTVSYTINLPQAATPTFSLGTGTYTSAQSVTISDASGGASIVYTTNGSTPTESSTPYTGPIPISATTTLNAIAFESGTYADSTVGTATYTITPPAATPTFSPSAGTYTSAQSVTISDATSGVTIHYTTDGVTTPSETTGTIYSGTPVSIGSTTTLKAIAYKSGLADSIVANGTYTITLPPTAPTFSPAAGTYLSGLTVGIYPLSWGITVRYTTDGSTPTETNGTVYSGGVSIGSTTILKAIAYGTGFTDSPVTSGIYTITSSPAPIVNVIYDFTTANNGGFYLPAALIQDSNGNLYGTTQLGGAGSEGTVFKTTTTGVLTTLYSFTGGADGASPETALVQGSDSNFYGTTTYGGSGSVGTVFKLTLTPSPTLTTLVSFTGVGANGANPEASLAQGTDGNFYGTTYDGGSSGYGTVFKVALTPSPALTTLASFNIANGEYPVAGLIQGSDGNFYGTTGFGGTANDGTVFKMTLTPSPALSTLFSFNHADGANPEAALAQGSDGNFYGTTNVGGSGSGSAGSAFRMTLAGSLTSLVSFSATNAALPEGALIQGSDGNFYGTTDIGGNSNDGTIFQMTSAGSLTSLVSFDGPNGLGPEAGVVQGSDGNFYGTTYYGGSSYVSASSPGYGVIFQLILPGVAAPAFSPAAGTYTSAQTVTITSATSGATIVYTTDGSTPTETNGTVYSTPVAVGATTTLKALAFAGGFTNSAVPTAVYTIQIQATPTTASSATPATGGGGGGAFDGWFLGFLAFAGLWRAWTRANHKRQ